MGFRQATHPLQEGQAANIRGVLVGREVSGDPSGGVALAGFIIGLVGMFAWCIAIAGVILNSVALLLSILNAILGIIMATSGNQHLWGP